MIPSILLGGEEHLVIRRKIQRAVRGEFGEGIVGCVSTMPNSFSIAGRGVCNPNRPWRYADRNEWKLLLQTGKTHKGNALAIRRPPWADVAISARRQIANAVAAEIVNGDEAMIAPAADKCYFASIGRPPRAGVFAPQIRELMSRSCPGYRSNPQLLVRSPNRKLSVRESSASSQSSSPQPISPSRRGVPPSASTAQTCCLRAETPLVGSATRPFSLSSLPRT